MARKSCTLLLLIVTAFLLVLTGLQSLGGDDVRHYFYGTVKLSALPSNDDQYPFAYLISTPKDLESYMDFKYLLTYSTHKAVYDAETDAIYIPGNYSWKCKQYSVSLGSTEFQLSGTYQNTDQSDFPINYAILGGLPLQWSNTNIYDISDATLYMEGSHPVLETPFDMRSFLTGLSVGRKLRGAAEVTHTEYISQGVCLEFTLEASKWNGTVYTITVSGHGVADELRLGLPANTSAVNAKRLIESALTLPYVRNYTSDGIQYISMEISATYAPTEDVQIAIWGFPQ